jgi:hypothetical protein
MERGFTTADGLLRPVGKFEEPRLLFVVTGSPTSRNPVEAFAQGIADEPRDRRYSLVGVRCSKCGRVELYTDGDPVG